MLIYVAGPLTAGGNGEMMANVRKAIMVGEELRKLGHCPIVPHLQVLAELVGGEHSWDVWMDWCMAVIPKCDAVYRMLGDSKGADMEVDRAIGLNIPVYTSMSKVPGPCGCPPNLCYCGD